jgi:predicted nucleotidyltransferase
MLKQEQVKKFVNTLRKKFPEIKLLIQFGSSVSGDFNKRISDVDLAIILSSKKKEKKIKDSVYSLPHSFGMQTHVYSMRDFLKNLKQADPLCLSILYAGKSLYGIKLFEQLKNKNFKPNKSSIRRCMLNSFAGLGLGISDLLHGMILDPVNSIYHAARSSIWATLMDQEITPNNKRIFELIKDKKIIELYRKIIDFRNNPPDYETHDFGLDKKIYKKGNINELTQYLDDATTIVKTNYKKIFGKDFIGLFELLGILRKKYKKIPKFYNVMLSVNWEKEFPLYVVMLAFKDDKSVLVEVSDNGKIGKELDLSEKYKVLKKST